MEMIRFNTAVYDRDGFQLALHFEISEGSFTAVLGPSGAGKSTLLNIIAGFENLAAGRLHLADVDHTSTPPAARPVSFVFQDNNSFGHLSARDNVGLGVAVDLRLNTSQWQAVDDAMAQVGIAHLGMRKPGEMSGGERQRIALARVLVRQKPILLLDEAFAALGPALRQEMLDLVRAMQRRQNLTVVMVTHQPEDAQRVAGQIVFVSNGIVRAPQARDAFFARPDGAVTDYLGSK